MLGPIDAALTQVGARILEKMRSLPTLDTRPINEMLYDKSGRPKRAAISLRLSSFFGAHLHPARRARRAAVHGGVQSTGQLYMGAATRAETRLAAHNAKGKPGALQIEALMVALHVETVDFTAGSLVHCQHGAEHHHHKVASKASLNMDDLFTYALARETGLWLFFQGTDFANTKMPNAMEKLGYGRLELGVPQPRP